MVTHMSVKTILGNHPTWHVDLGQKCPHLPGIYSFSQHTMLCSPAPSIHTVNTYQALSFLHRGA